MYLLEPSFVLPRARRGVPRAEITALIDVVLLLLLFVILTSQYMVTPGFDVVLPAAGDAGPPGSRAIVLEIPRSAGAPYFLNGRAVQPDELTARLAEVLRERPQEMLVIAPDYRATADRLLRALEEARKAGIHRIRIATRAAEASPATSR